MKKLWSRKKQADDAKPDVKKHHWSGWPGAWCYDCGLEDADELDIAGPPEEVYHRYSNIPHTTQPCAGCSTDERGCEGVAQPPRDGPSPRRIQTPHER